MSATPDALRRLAETALSALGRDAALSGETAAIGDGGWRRTLVSADVPLTLSLMGPDLPAGVPLQTASPQMVRENPAWTGIYTLKVRAPLTVLELAWTPDQPLRVLAFSRGSWEQALAALAPEPA